MKLPIYIGLPGTVAPRWLVSVGVMPGKEGEAIISHVEFLSLTAIWQRGGAYNIKSIFGQVPCALRQPAQFLVVHFHAPDMRNKPTLLHPGPIVKPWIATFLIGLAIGLLIR